MQIPTLPPKTILLIHLALFFLSLYASPLCDPSPPSDCHPSTQTRWG